MNDIATEFLTRRIADLKHRLAGKVKDIEDVSSRVTKRLSKGEMSPSDFQHMTRLAAECGAIAEAIGELETIADIAK